MYFHILERSAGLVYVYFAGNDFENLHQELENHTKSYLSCSTIENCLPKGSSLKNLENSKDNFWTDLETSNEEASFRILNF